MSETREINTLKAHLALNVRNVEESISFYRKMLGIEPSKIRTGYAKFDVKNPPLNLTLNQGGFDNHGALSHLGIQVKETADVIAMRKKWEDAGLLTRDEMQTNCCYALQDKTWVRDPDGNEWEVFVVLEDNLAETAPCACGTELEEATSEALPVDASSTCCTATPIGVNNVSAVKEASCC